MRKRSLLEKASHQQGEQAKKGDIIWSYTSKQQKREKQIPLFFPTAQKRQPSNPEGFLRK
jgi:hypothetical protein